MAKSVNRQSEEFALTPNSTSEEKRRPWSKSTRRILFLIIVGVVVLLIIGLVLALYYGLRNGSNDDQVQPETGKYASPCRTGSRFRNFSVASDTSICSKIGCGILEKGGSAMDATIASLLCITVVTMHSSGIGGGGFMLVYERATRVATFIDARETAPGAATKKMFVKDKKSSSYGPLSAGIPGELKGMIEAHKLFGKLEWSELVKPSVKLAEEGFSVTYAVARAIRRSIKYIKDSSFRALLTNKDGSLKKENDVIVNTALANTLKEIQKDPESFYSGSLAKQIAADFRNNAGLITEKDLKEYKVKVTKDVLSLDFPNEITMYSCPPPSGGSVVTQILNILQNFNLTAKSLSDVNSTVLTYHRIIEAFKFAYAERPSLGDPDFVDIKDIVANALNVEYNRKLYHKIWDNTTHNISYYDSSGYVDNDAGTTHISVVGPNGDAVSVTSSINFYFGGKFRSNVTGIVYNNVMDDFSTPGLVNYFGYPPAESNFIAPGKRPLSSMSPTIFVDKKTGGVRLCVGAAGGSRIITSTALVSLFNLWMGQSLSDSVRTPRFHNQLFPDSTVIEADKHYALDKDVKQGLLTKGHVLRNSTLLSIVQAVGVDTKERKIIAVSDPRKGGAAWGQ